MTTTETPGPWTEYIRAMDQALAETNATAAVRAWRNAYAAALGMPGWRGLVEVAAASLRIGTLPGFGKASEARARETYWTALFRARQEGSLDGVLRVAEAFADLGDREIVDRCIALARSVAVQARDARGEQRVRVFTERWAARKLEVEKQNGSGKVAR